MSKVKEIISVNNLVKKYDDFTAVNGINFNVSQGEIFGLLGPNGAGKTTTVEILEGLRSPSSGFAEIDGIDVAKNTKAVKKIIGVQLQECSFFDKLNLFEIIEMFSVFYTSKPNIENILEKVGLLEKRKSYYKTLSGGQKQRLSIAVALVNDPKVLFLDEPTTGLDPQARRNMWELIENIRNSGKTIIITTHYMEEAEKLCDRVAIIDSGQIVTINSPKNLIKELVDSGFKVEEKIQDATLEDVFIKLTGKSLREN
ncbi:MAG: ABC transporter ATP-binding protein [Chloroflexi bacterium]|nr:ABC transporter ATP-binding protein [Chloroflexota bacterium]MBK89902.1 ABC transporter ATP-binding protein [Chloroflexota bacterium]|tara:strand:- start:8148 stop:8915 length:768 start_codon:yes stop_codon:yes gene_type:complete